MPPSFRARAPGSLMLMGEYAVLHSYGAIVTAINKHITVSLYPRTDDVIVIEAESFGRLELSCRTLTIQKPFEYVTTALYEAQLSQGCTIYIEHTCPHHMGLGSSAAVTLALVTVLRLWKNRSTDRMSLYRHALHVIRRVQNGGSGSDLIASLLGGTVYYRSHPFTVHALPSPHPWCVAYTGSKTTTTVALERFQKKAWSSDCIHTLGLLSEAARGALQYGLLIQLGSLMNQAQVVLSEAGVSTPVIEHAVCVLRQDPEIFGVKISGSGLGDCIVALGSRSEIHTDLGHSVSVLDDIKPTPIGLLVC